MNLEFRLRGNLSALSIFVTYHFNIKIEIEAERNLHSCHPDDSALRWSFVELVVVA